MSGDNYHGEQPTKFYSEEITETKKVLLNNTNYVLELESMFVQARWRNESPPVSYTHLTLPTIYSV